MGERAINWRILGQGAGEMVLCDPKGLRGKEKAPPEGRAVKIGAVYIYSMRLVG